MRSMIVAFALTMAATVASAEPAVDTAPADLIFTDAHIKSPSGWVRSMAVRRGVIVAMDESDAAVMPLRGPATQVIDLHSAVVLPGLSDVHVHPLGAGLSELQ